MEVLATFAAIDRALRNDATLATLVGGQVSLHAIIAPEATTSGFYIIFELLDGTDSNAMGGQHIFAKPSLMVRVCKKDSGFGALGPVAKRVNELLEQEHGNVNGYWVGKFVRERVITDVDEVKTTRIFWLGMLYKVIAYEATV